MGKGEKKPKDLGLRLALFKLIPNKLHRNNGSEKPFLDTTGMTKRELHTRNVLMSSGPREGESAMLEGCSVNCGSGSLSRMNSYQGGTELATEL